MKLKILLVLASLCLFEACGFKAGSGSGEGNNVEPVFNWKHDSCFQVF